MNSSVKIAPSLLAADFGRLAEQIALVEQAGADLLHLDIMDGHFVPNLSIGVPVVQAVSKYAKLPLDTHLMITDPAKYAPAFVKAGATSITFHIEVVEKPDEMVRQLRDLGVGAAVSLNPGTPAEAIKGIVEQVDMVLVMTVWPGFGGQSFIRDCLEKIETISGWLRDDQALEVDGGIDPTTAPEVTARGANVLVAGSAVFRSENPPAALAALKRAAEEGIVQGKTEHSL